MAILSDFERASEMVTVIGAMRQATMKELL